MRLMIKSLSETIYEQIDLQENIIRAPPCLSKNRMNHSVKFTIKIPHLNIYLLEFI